MVPEFTVWLALAILALGSSWFLLPISWARALLWLVRRLAGFRSCDIDVNGRHWHYLTAGRGPVILALHGFGADADHWLRVGAVLRRNFRVIAPDLPGFGSSDPGNGLSFDISSQAARVGDFMRAVGITECIVAGSSMGGWIATTVACSGTARVRALWLLAPLGVADCRKGELVQAIESGLNSPLQIQTARDFEAKVFRPMFARPPWLPYPLRALYGRRAVARSGAARRMFSEVIAGAEPLEEFAAKTAVPALVSWGDQDRAVDISGLDRLAAAFPVVDTQRLQAVGHLPMIEAPGAATHRFLDFSRKHHLTEVAES